MSFPFFGEEFTFTQPDGGKLRVRGFGDQHHARFETLDGFTVVRNPESGFFEYAAVTPTGAALAPTGIRPGDVPAESIGLKPRLRPERRAARAAAAAGEGLPHTGSRWQQRRESARLARAAEPGITRAPPQRGTVGSYLGVCLLIQFPDVPYTIGPDEVDRFCNQEGYTGFGNNGSVYDYFKDVSTNKLFYKNLIAPYYTARHPRSYYTDESVRQPIRARELILEAIDYHRANGFDFSSVTVDDQNYVYALNVYYAGARVNNWAKGLWPHSFHLATPVELAPAKFAFDYQFTDMGDQLTLGTFCHENGHMICDFPDLYDYGAESRGIGSYCLMCAGGSRNKTNPTKVAAYLRYRAGWGDTITRIATSGTFTAAADRNDLFILEKSATEYYILENRQQSGRDSRLTDAGLAIWHVDELGDNSDEQGTPTQHYECALIQADGQKHLEHGVNDGDDEDLYHLGGNDRFSASTDPASAWWDGTATSFEVHGIGASASSMTFSVAVGGPGEA